MLSIPKTKRGQKPAIYRTFYHWDAWDASAKEAASQKQNIHLQGLLESKCNEKLADQILKIRSNTPVYMQSRSTGTCSIGNFSIAIHYVAR